MVALETVKLTRRFANGDYAVERLSLRIPSGRITAVIGRSGSGKTSLLRLLAGLDTPHGGDVRMDDETITTRPPAERSIGMVFQQFVLFPHWSVERNIAFSIRRQSNRRERVVEAARLLQLEPLLKRMPQQLSGGEQQRVAVARVLAARPQIALFDEPLAHVDAPLRTAIQGSLREWQRRYQPTVVYVTHDAREATALADELVVLDRGSVVECGAPSRLLRSPASPITADLLSVVSAKGHRHRIESADTSSAPAIPR